MTDRLAAYLFALRRQTHVLLRDGRSTERHPLAGRDRAQAWGVLAAVVALGVVAALRITGRG